MGSISTHAILFYVYILLENDFHRVWMLRRMLDEGHIKVFVHSNMVNSFFKKKILFKLVEGGITNKKFKPVLVVGCC
jgi:hypothetical protein